jgi:hypothetical protein
MLSVSCFIYDKTVFLLASNKALDSWIGVMSRTDMSDQEKEDKIRETVTDFTDIAVFITNEDVEITNDTNNKTIYIEVQGKFNFIVPFINDILGSNAEFESDSSFIYEGG